MRLHISGNSSLIQYAELARDSVGVPRLHLETSERGATFYEGSGLDDGTLEGVFIGIMPPDDSGPDVGACQIGIVLETDEEQAEFAGLVPFVMRSKDNLYVAFLAEPTRDVKPLEVWQAAE